MVFAAGAFFLAGGALAATPPSTAITNVASMTFGISGTPITVTGSHTVTTAASTPAKIEFLEYVTRTAGLPAGVAAVQNVPVTQCNAGAGFMPLPTPTVPGHGPLPTPASSLLASTSLYASGDVVFVRVTDYDKNVNPLVAETLDVVVSSSSQDAESLRLIETGPSTGIFIGYIQSSSAPMQPGNCVLNIGGNQKAVATYVDQSEGSIAITAAALVDPLGLVFDSLTGEPVNGVQIKLIDMSTGQPAVVIGNDGTSIYPSAITTGSTVTDSGGTVYSLGAGRYQFPRVAPGSYRFEVTPPAEYSFPSKVPTATLQALASGPFQIVAGSRGETFAVLPGPALEIDMPLDPKPAGSVNISKSAGKAIVAIGEFVPYTLTISNRNTDPIAAVQIADRLPLGFRYQAGSARLDAAALAEPKVSADGRGLEFSLGSLAASGTLTLSYVASVNAGARLGIAENTAQAVGKVTSNVAHASVQVREDLYRSRAILMGRVTVVESCKDEDASKAEEAEEAGQSEKSDKVRADAPASRPFPLKGVRVMLEDGTYILTDKEGQWHADNIRPGTHVVQLDQTTLPTDFKLQACEQNTRKGGRDFSQFVNVRGGTLWRADFRFVRVAGSLTQTLSVQDRRVSLRLDAPLAHQALSATLVLPDGAKVAQGSLTLDGKPFERAEIGEGFVVARLGAYPANWSAVLGFTLQAAPAGDLKAMVRLQPVGQPFQSLPPLVLKPGAAQASQSTPIALPPLFPPEVAEVAGAPGAQASPGPVPEQLQLIEQLPYDDKWVAAAGPGNEWLHPQSGFVPALPVIKVAVKSEAGHQVELRVNGALVDSLRYEGTVMNPAGTLGVSLWHAVELKDGRNIMEVVVRDAQQKVVLQESRTIYYAVSPASAVFDAARSVLLADGKTQPLVAVRMLDKEGQPVRRGVGGEFQVAAPFLAQDQANALQSEPLSGNLGGKSRYQVGDDGVALIALQPTTQSGEVVLNFDFGKNRAHEVRAWLKPDLREWVLVGFAEGTAGHKRLSGNLESIRDAGAVEQLFDQNRIALYAKGQVKGEYLLTAAYDTAKEKGLPDTKVLNQAVNPAQYYTLYADATQPKFDAASASKLYLKIEKSQFYAMFGDYDTGLTVTELGRYSRVLNGVKSEYKGERFSYNAFASLTTQGYHKDEIQGDGTSGLFRLSSGSIIVNSIRVRLEVRDRFHPEVIISTKSYTPYIDYQIDHALGTLFFREPIPSRDANFNPVFIVAEYESNDSLNAKLTYGGRAAMKVGEKDEVGVTHIREGNEGHEASLTALDTTLRFGDATKVRAEVATSQRNAPTGAQDGRAYIVELTHDDGQVTGRAYARQQDAGFGLGQQFGSAVGTRRIGADARVKLSDTLQLQAEAYRQENLVTEAQRDVVETRGQWTGPEGLALSAGARMAHETNSAGKESRVNQVLGGVGYELLDRRLALRATTEMDMGGSDTFAFPNRFILGADYKLTAKTTFFSQYEFARGNAFKADTTRVGLRTEPWTGGQVRAAVGNQAGLDSQRLFSDLGMVQKWQLDEYWRTDIGVDRVKTMGGAVAADPLGTTGTTLLVTDYTAVFAGLAYNDKIWSGNVRVERRNSDLDSKTNVLMGLQRNLDNGRAVAAGLLYSALTGVTTSRKIDARLSYAHRPPESRWVWLDRLEYVQEVTQSQASNLNLRKLINNFNANWTPGQQSQIALQYGAKYARETINDTAYAGYTDLMGVEARYDLGQRWDVGLHAGVLHSWRTGTRDYQRGASVGYKVADNAWLSVGYNQRGFTDSDFAGSQYRVKGLYLNLRIKFDQDTFDLNDRNKGQLPLKP